MIYAKVVDGKLELAPEVYKTEKGVITRPSMRTHLEHGYKPLDARSPSIPPPEGKYWVAQGYIDLAHVIRPKWVLMPIPPPPPRVFSKMKAVIALTEMGLWDKVKAWIDETGITDIYQAAQNFKEDDPFFQKGLAVLKQEFELSDEAIENLLSQCTI